MATNSASTTVENKIPDVSSLVKNTVNDPNHGKYIITPEFNTMAADVFKAGLAAQTDLIRKPDFDSKLIE